MYLIFCKIEDKIVLPLHMEEDERFIIPYYSSKEKAKEQFDEMKIEMESSLDVYMKGLLSLTYINPSIVEIDNFLPDEFMQTLSEVPTAMTLDEERLLNPLTCILCEKTHGYNLWEKGDKINPLLSIAEN